MGVEGYEANPKYANLMAGYLAGVTAEERRAIPSRELLDRAMHNLETGIAVVGLLKQFDESLMLMRRKLGWRLYPLYLRAKSNSTRPEIEDIPRSTRKAIREANHVDQKLYEYAQNRFQREWAQHPDLARQVARFRRINQYYQMYGGPLINVARIVRNLLHGRAPFHEYRIHDLTD